LKVDEFRRREGVLFLAQMPMRSAGEPPGEVFGAQVLGAQRTFWQIIRDAGSAGHFSMCGWQFLRTRIPTIL
jgi:hypothetical protein